MRKERMGNLSLHVRGGSERQTRMSEFARLFYIDEFTKIVWLRGMKEIMCDEDYFVMYSL